ncbi:hypothetical protein BVZ28_13650 [Alcaligenes faecalis]|uniref:Uncharacterized protein n=1 Tax=Alcaligenes faecalis TaxID=511 RepID=A0A1Z3ML05_ALCFA|nr:hypothetical protein [Alcaligenes faecalis]OSZ33055.1 hypothetical protein BVZ28_13650 [Alcaligenes faecalis]OSZ36361.1 hypothetical protein BVZ29_20060 [Alcaligenes faecalis]RSE57664.1 hypothetical protein EGT81_19720 [Alcaligenes faecalis]
MNRYTFDTALTATFTLQAESEDQARRILKEMLDCADCNGGLWPDGQPILFEASLTGDASLVSINDDFVE